MTPSTHVLVCNDGVGDRDGVTFASLQPSRPARWREMDAVAVQRHVYLAAGDQAGTVAQLLWDHDPSDVIDGRFLWEDATSQFRVESYLKEPDNWGPNTPARRSSRAQP
jgi:hypothetical protein